jgi:hypothetical protein
MPEDNRTEDNAAEGDRTEDDGTEDSCGTGLKTAMPKGTAAHARRERRRMPEGNGTGTNAA